MITPEERERIRSEQRRMDHEQHRFRMLVYAGIVVVVIVAVLSVGVAAIAWRARHNADVAGRAAAGAAKASCVLVAVIEQSADTTKRIRLKERAGSPKVPIYLKRERGLNKLAADMRKGVTCPPRGGPKIK